ncbi:MAG: FAD-binding protein [Lentisphaeria bacterium]|nr:FAD-binding protein [Lentisphaeria bacterium]
MKKRHVNTLVIGSGAAGLCAALRLYREGVKDILVITEGVKMGTSINTGSDKQTYYKLGMYGAEPDSPADLAKSYMAGGAVHGDIALVEAALSARGFLHLCDLGVPFPHDELGQYIGYKTDHDPRRRATSCGPYTSKEMCLALLRALKETTVEIAEKRIAATLLKVDGRAAGAVIYNGESCEFETVTAENTVFAVGGPGGLYANSVYPPCHTGAIGLAMRAGAKCRNLPESQFGLASIKFRWNVSGTYMQVLPRFVSTAQDGSDEKEFLREKFDDADLNSRVFLKGYQWPFDVKKFPDGSSAIDVAVFEETSKGRRVFLDFRSNPSGLDISTISSEAREYLERSNACTGTPIERLQKMNPGAISLYADHGIDISREMLEIAVCAQHNNGGIAGNIWYESENIPHLFPIGEVNGSHGVTRPGGSALNAGQAGAFRAAKYIAGACQKDTLDRKKAEEQAEAEILRLQKIISGTRDARADLKNIQKRMSLCAGFQRRIADIDRALEEAKTLLQAIEKEGFCNSSGVLALTVAQLAFSSVIYLAAIRYQILAGVGSRGSAAVFGYDNETVTENEEFRSQILTTLWNGSEIVNDFEVCRPLPSPDGWFENVWADYRNGKIFAEK